MAFMSYMALGMAHLLCGRFEEALGCAERRLVVRRGVIALMGLQSAALGHLGRGEEARAVIASLLRISPAFRVEALRLLAPAAVADCYLEGWRRAGWEETAA